MNSKFIVWVEENKKIQKLSEEMKHNLLEYIKENITDTKENCEKYILEKWDDTLGNCDNLKFDDKEVISYVIHHFLDRYQRMLLTLYDMYCRKVLPIKRNIYVLDIGTGPANSLFAICDFYKLIREFGNEYNIENYKNINIKIEYVEKSLSFRKWIHKFQEFLIKRNKYYEIPFHKGTFEDFSNISYTISYNHYYRNFRFDLVINSNFFTKANMKDEHNNVYILYRKEIENTIRKIKLNGLFVTLSSINYDFYSDYKKYLKGIKSFRGKDAYKLNEILDVNSNEFKVNTKQTKKELTANLEKYFTEISAILLENYKFSLEPEKKKYLDRKKSHEWKTIIMKKRKVD